MVSRQPSNGIRLPGLYTDYIDTEVAQNCASGLSKIITRKWTATDASGNSSTCIQTISLILPTLADVVLPPDYDGFDAPAFLCTDDACGNYPTPEVIQRRGLQGFPHVFGFPTGCTINWGYDDLVIEVCDGTYKIRREWTILDWCIGDGFTYNQIIKVLDYEGPVMSCPAALTVSIDPFSCCATTNLPDVLIEDNCSRVNNISGMVVTFEQFTGQQTGMYTFGGTLTDFPGNNHWDPDTLGAFGWTPCLPQGNHLVTYIAEDDCGNTTSCVFELRKTRSRRRTMRSIHNRIAGPDGTAVVNEGTFDDGSYDQCCFDGLFVRRMESNSCSGTSFEHTVTFCCDDIGETIIVVLRATDCAGNTNDCMVEVQVQDKQKPVCLPPANVTVACENFDPSLWLYGIPDVLQLLPRRHQKCTRARKV